MSLPGFELLSALLVGVGVVIAVLRARWIVAAPRSVLLILAVVTLGAAATIVRLDPLGLRIDLDPSSDPLIPLTDPGRDVYRRAALAFGSDDIYVVAMETDDVFTESHLKLLKDISSAIRRLPGVRRAESLVDVYSFRYDRENDWVEVADFIEDVPEDRVVLANLRRRALANPLYTKTIVSRDGHAAAINVRFRPMSDRDFVRQQLDEKIRAILVAAEHPGVRFYVAGRPHVRAAAYHLMVRDLVRLIPLAVAVAAFVVYILTGSPRSVFIPLVSCLVATLWSFGGLAAVGKDLNLITIVLGPLLICVGSVYGVHVTARNHEIGAESPDARTAALRTLEYTRIPVLMAGFTTCVGFGALMLADIPATSDLGLFALLGVAYVTLISLTGVPAVLALLPLQSEARGTRLARAIGRHLDRGLRGLTLLAVEHSSGVLVGWGIVGVLAVALIPQTVIDTDYLRFFDPDSRVRTDFAHVNQALVGVVPIYVVFEGREEGLFRKPETLRRLEAIESALERTEGVSEVLSLVDFVAVVNRAFAHEGRVASRIPATRAGVAEAMFMVPKDRMRSFATSNHSSANLVVRTDQMGSRSVRQLEERIRKVVARHPIPGIERVDVTGNTILINRSADGIAGNQSRTVGAATLAIFALVCLVFRSLPIASLTMLPNVLPVLVFFGTLGAGVAVLSLPTGLIGSTALGIAIDDTLHFLVSYQRMRGQRRTPAAAARYCIETVGRPIVTTSVMLIAGFLVLLLSGFATLREFGYLTAITMAICLSTDLLLFPALLVRTRA
ncbi:MAG: RND family transporter [Myxococcota bacterium]